MDSEGGLSAAGTTTPLISSSSSAMGSLEANSLLSNCAKTYGLEREEANLRERAEMILTESNPCGGRVSVFFWFSMLILLLLMLFLVHVDDDGGGAAVAGFFSDLEMGWVVKWNELLLFGLTKALRAVVAIDCGCLVELGVK